jgi:hypothetical protein
MKTRKTGARGWFGLTALAVFTGIVVQVFVSANANDGAFPNPNRSSTVFKVFRLTVLVAITITGIVFHAVLARLLDLEATFAS